MKEHYYQKKERKKRKKKKEETTQLKASKKITERTQPQTAQNHRKREITNARKTSHEHNKNDLQLPELTLKYKLHK